MTNATQENEKSTTLYELMVIIVPNISEDKTNKELDAIRKQIKDGGGSIVHEDIWGSRNLAYTIKKHDTGYYAVFNFEAENSALPELEKMLRFNNKVLRHLVIKPPKGYIAKTQDQYEKEAEEMKAAEQKKKEEAKTSRIKKTTIKKKETTKLESIPTEKPVKEAVEEVVEKASKKEEKDNSAELDKKLESIIDDPDITL